jgi:hypothetical protein
VVYDMYLIYKSYGIAKDLVQSAETLVHGFADALAAYTALVDPEAMPATPALPRLPA